MFGDVELKSPEEEGCILGAYELVFIMTGRATCVSNFDMFKMQDIFLNCTDY